MRRRGEGRLFEGLREWVPGDDTRTIDWKATARRGKPIARQYEDERRQQVMLVLDAGRLLTAEVDGVPRLESVIAAALHLAHAAVEHDDNVGLLVFADTVQRYVRARRAAGGRSGRCWRRSPPREGRLVESDYPAAFRYLAAPQPEARAHRALHRRDRPDGERGAGGAGRHAAPAAPAARGDAARSRAGARSPQPARPAPAAGVRARGRRGAARCARGRAGGDAVAAGSWCWMFRRGGGRVRWSSGITC